MSLLQKTCKILPSEESPVVENILVDTQDSFL